MYMHHFAKTGSGQTQGKQHSKRAIMPFLADEEYIRYKDTVFPKQLQVRTEEGKERRRRKKRPPSSQNFSSQNHQSYEYNYNNAIVCQDRLGTHTRTEKQTDPKKTAGRFFSFLFFSFLAAAAAKGPSGCWHRSKILPPAKGDR